LGKNDVGFAAWLLPQSQRAQDLSIAHGNRSRQWPITKASCQFIDMATKVLATAMEEDAAGFRTLLNAFPAYFSWPAFLFEKKLWFVS